MRTTAPPLRKYRITFLDSAGRRRYFTSREVVSTSAAKREAERYIAKYYGPEGRIVRISEFHLTPTTSEHDEVEQEF